MIEQVEKRLNRYERIQAERLTAIYRVVLKELKEEVITTSTG